MFFGSNQKIRRLDRQSKFQRCTPFPAAMLEDQRSPPTWRLHSNYYFARNNSTNRSTLGQRTHLKLGKLSSLFIVYNITISWLYPLHGFQLRSTKWNANLILLRDYAELVALCKVIVWKSHIPVRTQKWPPLLIFAGACHGIVINHVTGHSY